MKKHLHAQMSNSCVFSMPAMSKKVQQLQHYNTSRGRIRKKLPDARRSRNAKVSNRALDDIAIRVLELPYARYNESVPAVPLVVCPFCDVVLPKQLKNHLSNCKEVQLPNQSSSRDLSKCSYRNALTLIDIFGAKAINPLHRNVQSYLPQFSPNPVELLQYASIQVTPQERFYVPQQEMGKRLVSEKNELALLSDGGNSAQELLHESSLSLCSNTLPMCLKSFHQASPPPCEGEMDFMKGCFVRAVRETRGGGGRREFVSGFGMRGGS